MATYTVRKGSNCVIGRNAVADVFINHESVSSRHCTVKLQELLHVDRHEETSNDSMMITAQYHRQLQATITDHSSNGTWIIPSRDPSTPYRLVKGVVTNITVGDCIVLLNPRHPQSHDCHVIIERGTTRNEIVLRKTTPTTQRRKRSSSVDKDVIPLSKVRKIVEEKQIECDKHRSSDPNVIITSITGTRPSPYQLAPPPIIVTSMITAPTFVPIIQNRTKMDKCVFCGELFPPLELANHMFRCSKSSASITATPTPATPTLVTSAPSTHTSPITNKDNLERCPRCLSIFDKHELISHMEKCPHPPLPLDTILLDGDKEHCQFCMKVLPVVELVDHAITCDKRVKMDDEVDDCIISSVTLPTDTSHTTNTVLPSNTTIHTPSSTAPLVKDLSKEQCPKCLRVYNLSELISHYDTCSGKGLGAIIEDKEHCEFCLKLFPVSELVYHSGMCSKSPSKLSKGTTLCEDIERCMKCFCDFPISQIVNHSLKCDGEMMGPSTERFKEFLPSVHDVDAMALSVLTPTQQSAVDYVREMSKSEANDKYPELCTRIIELGYTPKDLQRVLHWVRHDAPIIIHLNLDRALHFLIKDTHYRNLFETHSSGGSSSFSGRKAWEDRMFSKIYHSSSPMDRVKYGVLNIVGDPAGVRCCYSYGDSFLQLKKVRLRTTFASMDTSSPFVKLSCCEHYGNVLHEYSDAELKAILQVATRKKPYLKSSMISHYKEVQIHGPVCLSENVDCIVANHRHRGNREMEKMLETFVKQNNCNLIWMDEHQDYDY